MNRWTIKGYLNTIQQLGAIKQREEQEKEQKQLQEAEDCLNRIYSDREDLKDAYKILNALRENKIDIPDYLTVGTKAFSIAMQSKDNLCVGALSEFAINSDVEKPAEFIALVNKGAEPELYFDGERLIRPDKYKPITIELKKDKHNFNINIDYIKENPYLKELLEKFIDSFDTYFEKDLYLYAEGLGKQLEEKLEKERNEIDWGTFPELD